MSPRPTFTEAQRVILLRRISRAIAWANSAQYQRDDANRIAETIVKELEVSGFSAATQRRAITNIADRMERVG